jgi:lipoate-protein ligase B
LDSNEIHVQDWGLIDYASALQRQMDLVDLILRPKNQQKSRDTLVFCSHPPVVTLGRGTRPGDVFGWSGETVEVSRGGRATYHGPSQIVVYPIIDLNERNRDLHKLMRAMENAIVATLADFSIRAEAHSLQTQDGDTEPVEATGVWIGARKIASIGIGVRKWISFHGLALNIEHDPRAFEGMKPCGFATGTMISMEEILGSCPERAQVQLSLRKYLLNELRHAQVSPQL